MYQHHPLNCILKKENFYQRERKEKKRNHFLYILHYNVLVFESKQILKSKIKGELTF